MLKSDDDKTLSIVIIIKIDLIISMTKGSFWQMYLILGRIQAGEFVCRCLSAVGKKSECKVVYYTLNY